MPLDFHPHEIVLDRETQLPRVLHKRDYVRLLNAGESVYVQEGYIYLGGGDPVSPDQAPAWFWDSYRALTPLARKSVGLALPQDKVHSLDQLPTDFVRTFQELPEDLKELLLADATLIEKPSRMPEKAPKISDPTSESSSEKSLVLDDPGAPKPGYWTCGQCGEDVPMKHKGVHIGAHTRRANYEARHALDETEG